MEWIVLDWRVRPYVIVIIWCLEEGEELLMFLNLDRFWIFNSKAPRLTVEPETYDLRVIG